MSVPFPNGAEMAGAPAWVGPRQSAEVPLSLEQILDATGRPAPRRIDGVVIGVMAGRDPSGSPLVSYPDMPAPHPLPARTLVALEAGAVGREVALLFEGGDPCRPIVMGLLHRPPGPAAAEGESGARDGEPHRTREVEVDGRRITISAKEEIVLRCGQASITLTAAGKVLIQGAYLSSRSTGVNRIKGGSVQIN